LHKRSRLSRSRRRRILRIAVLLLIGLPVASKLWLHLGARDHIYRDIAKVPKCRVGMVLGARVYSDGKLSPVLADRVNTGIALYKAGKVEKLLMSGDNCFIRYNEPQRMRNYAVAHGVPAEDIGMDFAGRRTYDSVYRAKHIFGLDKMIVVTQAFHLDRSLYYCRKLGVEGYGVRCDVHGVPLRVLMREVPGCLGAIMELHLWQPRPVAGKRETI
jgi:SanA protein